MLYIHKNTLTCVVLLRNFKFLQLAGSLRFEDSVLSTVGSLRSQSSQYPISLLRIASIFQILAANRLLRFENSFLSKYRFGSLRTIHNILLTCFALLLYFTFFKLTGSLRLENSFLSNI
jgi:hypothetical protein